MDFTKLNLMATEIENDPVGIACYHFSVSYNFLTSVRVRFQKVMALLYMNMHLTQRYNIELNSTITFQLVGLMITYTVVAFQI